MKTLQSSDSEVAALREQNETVFIPSYFNFLSAHCGLRPGEPHLLLGTTGSGKSTLARKILIDTCKNHKTLLWLSEESRDDVLIATSKLSHGRENFSRVIVQSELDIDDRVLRDPKKVLAEFKNRVMLEKPDVVFFDNITTSAIYPSDFSVQDAVARELKLFFKKTGIACFIIAHTGSGINESTGKLIEDTDIRGSKTIMNLMPYVYIFQRFFVRDQIIATIRIKKSRNHLKGSNFYRLYYSSEENVYTGDVAVSFEDFKKVYSERDRL